MIGGETCTGAEGITRGCPAGTGAGKITGGTTCEVVVTLQCDGALERVGPGSGTYEDVGIAMVGGGGNISGATGTGT